MQLVARAKSSAIAWSGERPRKAVKFLTGRMYPVWVFGVKPRIVISSIMRRRKRADSLVLHGSAPGFEVRSRNLKSQHRTDPSRYRADPADCHLKLLRERFRSLSLSRHTSDGVY